MIRSMIRLASEKHAVHLAEVLDAILIGRTSVGLAPERKPFRDGRPIARPTET